jgi:hypothetical protein
MLATLIASQSLVALVSAAPTPEFQKLTLGRKRAQCLQSVLRSHSHNDNGLKASVNRCIEKYGTKQKEEQFDRPEVEGCLQYCDDHYQYAGDKTVCVDSCTQVYGLWSDSRKCKAAKTGCQDFPLNNENIMAPPPMGTIYDPPSSGRSVQIRNRDGSVTNGVITYEDRYGNVKIRTPNGMMRGTLSGNTLNLRD